MLFIKKLANHFEVTDEEVLENATQILRKLNQQGYNTYVKATVAFILALRNSYCEPIPLERIVSKAVSIAPERIKEKSIKNLYRKLKKKIPPKTCYLRPTIYVKFACKKLGLSQKTLETALQLTEKVCEAKLHVGKKPTVVAGAIVYCASRLTRELRTQLEVAMVLEVTEVALRNTYKKIAHALGLIKN